MVEKIKSTYYGLTFVYALAMSFFFATYVLFLNKAGLNMLEINLINAFFMVACFFLEVPTGAVADCLGRKFSFVLSCFVLSLSFFVYYFSESFWWFVLAEVIGGLGITLYSGAFEAWMVDSIKFHEPDYDFNSVFARGNQFDQLGVIFGSFSGAYLAKGDLSLPWLLSAVGMSVVGVLAIIIMKEKYFEKSVHSKKTFAAIINIGRDSIHYGIKNRSVFYLIILGTLIGFLVSGTNMQWQILFGKQYGLDVSHLGWLFVGIVVFTAIGSEIANRYGGKIRSQNIALIFCSLIIGLGIFLCGLSSGLIMLLSCYYIQEIARGGFQPIKQAYLNKHIPSEKRATIISFDSMIGRIGLLVGLLGSGWLAMVTTIQNTWAIMSVAFLALLVVFIIGFREK